jgi:Na+-driven multidrug efflux pump
VFTFLFAFCLLLASPVLLHIFTKDAEVVRLGCSIMQITFPFYFLYTILECLSSNLRGHGKALLPMIVTIISFCGFRLLLLFLIMGSSRSIQSVAMTYPVSWAFAVLLLSGVSLYEKRRFTKRNG